MKLGIIGAGGVGASCVLASVMRGFARTIVLLDKDIKRAKGVVTDIQYGIATVSVVDLIAGDYPDLAGCDLVMITAGINEKTGGATDRSDSSGRLKLLGVNAQVYRDILTKLKAVCPQAMILVVTDPPDPLAQLTIDLMGHNKVLSAGTFLDSLRFRYHVARHFGTSPSSVQSYVVGEHGTSEVFLWSSVLIGGAPVKIEPSIQKTIQQEVRYANITIIEGISSSQYGIGMVCAKIAEMVMRDERAVFPVGSYQQQYGVVLSLPSLIGKSGVIKVFDPKMDPQEHEALEKSAAAIKNAYMAVK